MAKDNFVTFKPLSAKKNFNLPASYRAENGQIVKSPLQEYRSKSPGSPPELLPKPLPWEGREAWVLDKNNEDDLKKITYLLNCPLCLDSPFFKKQTDKSKALYMLYDPEAESRKRLDARILRQKAEAIISEKIADITVKGLVIKSENTLRDVAVLCGAAIDDSNTVMLDMVMQIAEENPQIIIDAVDEDKGPAIRFINELQHYGVVTKSVTGVYQLVGAGPQSMKIGKVDRFIEKLGSREADDESFKALAKRLLDKKKKEAEKEV